MQEKSPMEEEVLSISETAKRLDISIADVKTLVQQQILHPKRNRSRLLVFSPSEINRIKSNTGLTLSDEAAQVGAQLQREIHTSFAFIQKGILFLGWSVLGYCCLVIFFAILFILFPLQAAEWFGYTTRSFVSPLAAESGAVLGTQTNLFQEEAMNSLQAVFKPVNRVSLNIVKYINPTAYARVSKVSILDPNDILTFDASGGVTALQPIKLPQSSFLEVGDSGLVTNLNSEYLQGKKPGNNVGDIALVQDPVAVQSVPVSEIAGAVASPITVQEITNTIAGNTIITSSNTVTGLTNANFSGNAGITNANLANPGIRIETTGPLIGGGAVSLGGVVTLSCPTCTTGSSSSASFITVAASGSNSTISDGDTFTLAAGNNITTANDGAGTITVGTSATPLFTTVNGLTIANNGSNTFSLAGGKTLSVANSLTFLGTDGTTFTFPASTDTLIGLTASQTLTNKTLSAASNSISGLGTSNFSSTAISQWTNDTGFITSSTVNTLTNKTIAAGANTITGLTNTNLSGAAGITNANLANSSVTVNTTGPLSGGTTVSLGGSINLSCPTCLASGGTLFTLAATSGMDSSITQGSTLILSAGSNLTTTNNGSGGITVATTATPTFTTINGLTITNNGTNTLSIAAGKTLSANNSLIFSGIDGTTLTFQGTDTYVGRATTDTFTNKTLAASSNTISGLTNTNLSGSAGITNANLANSSLTITTSTGISGGGLVSLGSGLTLTNSGVTSLLGTSNQVNVSGATGDVTLSLPQNIHTSATPTFSHLNLSNTANQLVLGTSNTGTLSWSPTTTRTLTLPDGTDTLVGKTTTDVLTNKTLSAPAINGTVTTTGLTLPAFIASGNIIGSGTPTIASFGSINGLTFTAASDGFTIAGGTTARTLTFTGADLTLGSIIKPTAAGALSMQSTGAHALKLDSGGLAEVNIATESASAVNIGRSGITTTISGTASANNLKVGNGTTIVKHLSGTNTFDAAGIALGSCGDIGTVTVTGASLGDTVTATPTVVSSGIETLLLNWNAYVSSSNTVTIRACSVATLGTQNPANQTWRADVWQH